MNDLVVQQSIREIAERVTADLASPHTRRAYARHLTTFIGWLGSEPITPVSIRAFLDFRKAEGMRKHERNQSLTAIKKLARQARDAGKIDFEALNAILEMKGEKVAGAKHGNRLTLEQAQALLDAPDSSLMGLRDRAILSVMLGAGLRRSEVAALEFKNLTMIAGHWRIVDVDGKHGKLVNAKLAKWGKKAIDEWAKAARIRKGKVFLAIGRYGEIFKSRQGLNERTIYQIVKRYAPEGVAPHDLRRTFAALSREFFAPIEGIKSDLGHESLATTDLYIGGLPDSAQPSGDYIDIVLAPH